MRVTRLRRYPIKSMLGEDVSFCEVTEAGLAGDRAVALVDARTRELVSCKQPRRWGRLFELSASLSGGLNVTFPDGRVVFSEDLEPALSEFLGREVYLVEGLDFFDVAPLHLVTTGSLASLEALEPRSRFEVERFRPNVVLESTYAENDWVGRELRLGPSAVVEVEGPTHRCVMTTLPQGDLPADKKVLKTITRHHGQNFGMYARLVASGVLRVGDRASLV